MHALRTISQTRRFGTARRVVPALALTAVLGLSACGFQPRDAYNPKTGQNPALSRIYVAPIKDRDGQIIRTHLNKLLNPSGKKVPYAYQLDVKYNIDEVSRGTRSDDSAIQLDLTMRSTFKLTHSSKANKTKRTLVEGFSEVVTRAINSEELYSAYTSKLSAQHRAAVLTAQDIARQVRLYFKYPNRYPVIKTEPKPQPKPATTTRPQRNQFYGQSTDQ